MTFVSLRKAFRFSICLLVVFHFYGKKAKTMLTTTYKMQATKGIQLHTSVGITLLMITGSFLYLRTTHRW